MGCDIHSYVEVKQGDKWEQVDGEFCDGYSRTDPGDEGRTSPEPFGWRSYSVFAFLAGVRNYSQVLPLAQPKGFPEDASDGVKSEWEPDGWHGDGHSASWFTVRELIDFDYEQEFEDRRHNGDTVDIGKGDVLTYRDYLGKAYFLDLETLRSMGDPDTVRVVFWFDN